MPSAKRSRLAVPLATFGMIMVGPFHSLTKMFDRPVFAERFAFMFWPVYAPPIAVAAFILAPYPRDYRVGAALFAAGVSSVIALGVGMALEVKLAGRRGRGQFRGR